jgi:hypothetical protein
MGREVDFIEPAFLRERLRDRVLEDTVYEGMNRPLIAEIIADELPPLMPRLREIRDIVRTEFDAGGA